jgi:pimeloyl-ACP methyl ester carboxylesterase
VRRDVTVDGHRLEVHCHGPAPDAALTLVFLHEGLGSAAQWRAFPAQLADRFGVGAVVYSRAGYGRSAPVTLPRPLAYMEHEGEVVLPQLLDALGVHAAVLIGHSDGASIAVVHAGMPDPGHRIRGVVLEAPHVCCEAQSVAAITRARDDYEHGGLRARLAAYHDDVDVAFWGWNRAWLDPGFRAWSLERYLPGIRAPVMMIQGDRDPYGTLAQLDAIERAVPGARRVVLAGCGHATHREQPGPTFAAIEEFLRAVLAG